MINSVHTCKGHGRLLALFYQAWNWMRESWSVAHIQPASRSLTREIISGPSMYLHREAGRRGSHNRVVMVSMSSP
jgi:hypothetical protein